MTDRELMKWALYALEGSNAYDWPVVEELKERLAQPEQEPVAWMHNFIEGNVITHRPADLDRYPDRWAALYKTPPPCQTCEALARTVMMDQTSHDMAPRQWQGLTDDEKQSMVEWAHPDIIDAIELRLRERNT